MYNVFMHFTEVNRYITTLLLSNQKHEDAWREVNMWLCACALNVDFCHEHHLRPPNVYCGKDMLQMKPGFVAIVQWQPGLILRELLNIAKASKRVGGISSSWRNALRRLLLLTLPLDNLKLSSVRRRARRQVMVSGCVIVPRAEVPSLVKCNEWCRRRKKPCQI